MPPLDDGLYALPGTIPSLPRSSLTVAAGLLATLPLREGRKLAISCQI